MQKDYSTVKIQKRNGAKHQNGFTEEMAAEETKVPPPFSVYRGIQWQTWQFHLRGLYPPS